MVLYVYQVLEHLTFVMLFAVVARVICPPDVSKLAPPSIEPPNLEPDTQDLVRADITEPSFNASRSLRSSSALRRSPRLVDDLEKEVLRELLFLAAFFLCPDFEEAVRGFVSSEPPRGGPPAGRTPAATHGGGGAYVATVDPEDIPFGTFAVNI